MRRRLMIAIAGVAAAAVMLFALPLALVLQRNYRNEELLRLQRDTIAATRAIDLGAPRRDPIELPPTRDQLAVYNAAGQRVAGRGPARADELVRAALRTASPADRAQDGRLLAAVPLLARERVSGAVRAQRSDAAAARDTHRAWVALAGLAAIVVALAVLAASLLGRRLARPLERLAAAARRLGDGDFGARAPRGGVPEADQIAAALDDTARRLGNLVARERAFSADASHQLRTPLAALRIELEAIELRGDPPPELPRALAQVDRLQATIDTLLAVARDAPRSPAHSDLAALLSDIETRWRGPLAADARPLHLLQRTEHPVARAAPAIVTEILDVLLDNARRHGHGPVTITVRAIDPWLAVDVSDQGPGFTDSTDHVFSRRTASRDGHGIGLALARALAHAEGGRLAITQPRPPTVTLWLPRPTGGSGSSPGELDRPVGASPRAGHERRSDRLT
jgi:signal transduction histidine kinase